MGALISSVLSLIKPTPRRILRTCYNLPLPPIVHREVTAEELGRYRHVFVIGDVHGCADELESLLDEAKAADEDTLKIFAGDMINKGPDSPRVVQMLRRMPHFAVRGNNEEAVLRECRSLQENLRYELPAKYKWVAKLSPADVDYLRNLPYSLFIPSLDSVIVHAGLVPGKPLEAQQPIDMVSMRNLIIGDYFDEGGIQATSEIDEGTAWAPLWPGPLHVYFGHDAMRKLQRHSHATGLDTGCVYGGELTGIFLKGERKGQTVSVHAKSAYKTSKARNSLPTPTL